MAAGAAAVAMQTGDLKSKTTGSRPGRLHSVTLTVALVGLSWHISCAPSSSSAANGSISNRQTAEGWSANEMPARKASLKTTGREK